MRNHKTCVGLGIAMTLAGLLWGFAFGVHWAEARFHDSIINGTATCYDLNGQTASGYWVGPRVAAHDFFPFGTKIRLVGKQTGPRGIRRYIIRDTGPALSDGHFDLWSYKGHCMRFGVRHIKYKFGWGKPR